MREANCVTELAELLVLKRLDILKEPIRGSLQSIYLLYKSFCEETTFSFGGFLKNLQYLNQITNGGAFEMEGGIELLERYHQLWINEVDDSKNNIANIQTRAFDDYQLRIVNIDKLVIKLLLDKMKEKAKEGLEPKSNSSKLVNTPLLEPENNSFKLFNTPLLESNNNSSNLVNTPLTRMMKVLSSRNPENPTYESLCKMLASPTAHQKLAREKASLVTPKTPFLEICDHNTHSLELAAVSYFESRSRNDHSYYKPKGDNNSYAIHINRKLYNKLSNDLKQCLQHKIHFVPIVKSSDFRKEQLKNVHCSKLSGDYIKSLKELNISNTYGSVSTDVALGDCSYLDTCYKLSLCRYIHYYKLLPIVELSKQIFETNTQNSTEIERISDFTWNETSDYGTRDVLPAQWLNCDVTQLDFDILGKFAAIIADPSWNIHMNLPYSSSNDNELCDLPIAKLQDNGVIFLWVTGRAIEQGKSCLKAWGYTYCNEIVWIKTNQLNKTICTGRTGHWLNHSKEHLLVG